LSALDSSTRRFMEICEADGFEWDEAGLRAMLAWLSYMFHSTSITGETAEQYVSSVNAAYATMALHLRSRQGPGACIMMLGWHLLVLPKLGWRVGDEIPSATYRPQPKRLNGFTI
jgi:hypothetical protein